MKKLLAILALSTMVFTACNFGSSDVENTEEEGNTEAGTEIGLTIGDEAADGTEVDASLTIEEADEDATEVDASLTIEETDTEEVTEEAAE